MISVRSSQRSEGVDLDSDSISIRLNRFFTPDQTIDSFFLGIDSFGHATLELVVKFDVTRLKTKFVVEIFIFFVYYLFTICFF